jgi:hypothetical protein
MQRLPVRLDVSAPLGEREALARVLVAEGEPARAQRERRACEQRFGPQGRRLRNRLKHIREAVVRLFEIESPKPERPQGNAQTQRVGRHGGEQRVQRGAEVRRFPVEPRRALLRLGEASSEAGQEVATIRGPSSGRAL